MRRIQCLKYLVLATMLMESDVDPFDAQVGARGIGHRAQGLTSRLNQRPEWIPLPSNLIYRVPLNHITVYGSLV